jgi:hypothetical protein
MKSSFLLLFTTLLGFTVSGCDLQLGCTEVGCSDSVHVSVEALASTPVGSLPLLVTSCVDSSCFSARITKSSADTFECALESGSLPGGCGFLMPGGDLLFDVFLDEPARAQATVNVSMTITDNMNAKVFDEQKIVKLETSMPNGPDCGPICRQGGVSFTP